ncbi:MAG TPA: hypothetical protein VGF58_11200 [Burkholderiales bacterium]
MVNFNELVPEALTLASSTGVDAPERIPELSPNMPEMSAGESKPTHLMTAGCEHLVVKFALVAGGAGEGGAEENGADEDGAEEGGAEEGGAEEGVAEATEPPPEPPPPPLQAATAKATSAQSEGFLMAVVRALMGAW